MKQQAFTIVTEVRKQDLKTLKSYLQKIGKGIKSYKPDKVKTGINFSDYEKLHYCSFFIIEEADNTVPLLVFEGNIDGDVKQFLAEMINQDFDFISKVYSSCTDHPQTKDSKEWTAYLNQYDKGYNAFFRGHPGRSQNEIKFEQSLRQQIEKFLDDNEASLSKKSADVVRKKIQQFVLGDKDLKQAQVVPEVPFEIRHGPKIFGAILTVLLGSIVLAGLGVFGIVIQIVLIAALVAYYIWLRHAETHDKSFDGKLESTRINDVVNAEDIRLQNHLTSVIYVKPGNMRLMTLKVILFVVNLLARFVATKGSLSGIVTIHFARWFIINAGNDRYYMVFFSNYDGSWENYLGEFIDLASIGLTSIWSNTQQAEDEGFPETQCLVKGGARHEQEFKNFARNSQYTELIWYAAYPDLSVKNVINNMKIRDQLFDQSVESSDWLRRF